MAIVGIGTDIVAKKRIASSLQRSSALAERILTQVELEAFAGARDQAAFLAKRFAAKEAAAKALGTGIAQGISFQQIVITHTPAGQPCLQFELQALQRAYELGASSFHISISDEADYAIAYVILEGNEHNL